MKRVYPDYYKDFRCIAGKCNHNCCIGWEIDIDPATDEFYKTAKGNLSERFMNDISREDDTPHFILKENDRCPFLNDKNLCDIITEHGEEHLCTICSEHPRFHNNLPQRVESGLGMCCEEAARLILTKKDKVSFISEKGAEDEDEIIALRDKAIEILQNRDKTLDSRCRKLLSSVNYTLPFTDMDIWTEVFLSLERLDENWGKLLEALRASLPSQDDISAFLEFMGERTAEYEQLGVYLLYRHTANAPDLFEASLRIAFSVLSIMLMVNIGAYIYRKDKKFTLADQIEICRMFSCEVEYSDENLYILYDELS